MLEMETCELFLGDSWPKLLDLKVQEDSAVYSIRVQTLKFLDLMILLTLFLEDFRCQNENHNKQALPQPPPFPTPLARYIATYHR